MKKIYFIIASLIFANIYSQHFEAGPNIGYGFVNIVNSKSAEKRAVIGDALWSLNYGASVMYYFNDESGVATGIHAKYNHNLRGSVSEIYKDSRIVIPSDAVSIAFRIGKNSDTQLGYYLDAGFGYNMLGKMTLEGNRTQKEAFNKNLEYDIVPKSNEVTFVYSIGIDKLIPKTKIRAFFEVNGDAAISKISDNLGSYRTQGITIATGARYVFR